MIYKRFFILLLFFILLPSFSYAYDEFWYSDIGELESAMNAYSDALTCTCANPANGINSLLLVDQCQTIDDETFCNTEYPSWIYTVTCTNYDILPPEPPFDCTKVLSAVFVYGTDPFPNDDDEDGIQNDVDNCIDVYNPDQLDFDEDGLGDLCDDDMDGDGITNFMDLYPLDSTDFEWKLLAYEKDFDGFYTYVKLLTERGDTFVLGEQSDDLIDCITIGAIFNPSSEIESFLSTQGLGESDFIDGDIIPVIYEGVETETGETGGVTDTDKLENIESNTSSIADNQQAVVDGLITIADKMLDEENKRNIRDEEITAIRAETEASLDAIGHPTYSPYESGDVPSYTSDKTEYETALTDLSESSGISNVRDNLGIVTTGSTPVLSCSLFGYTINFDFSVHSSLLAQIGTLWISLCYLSGFLIIMRS